MISVPRELTVGLVDDQCTRNKSLPCAIATLAVCGR